MGLMRGLGVAVVALIGVIIGVVGFLAIGLLAISPPTISQAAPGQPWDVTLDITNAFLTTQMNKPRASSSGSSSIPIQLSDAKAAMHADGTVTITGNLGRSGGTAAPSVGRLPINVNGNVAVEIVLRPKAADGKLTVEVVSAQLGPLPIPANLGGLLDGPINDQIANALNGQSFAITELTVRDGAMLVRAKQSTP
jgi:LmeA-like phospholipid-binding